MDTSLTNTGLVQQAFDCQMILKAIVREVVPCGFILRLMGVDVFLPESELADGTAMKPGKLVDICVIKLKEDGRLPVVSNRKALRIQRRNELLAVIDDLHAGDVCRVMVMEFAKRGIVVSAGGILGIVPYKMLSWKYYSHPSEICSVGQEMMAVLMSKEESDGHVRLIFSVKDMERSPWREELHHYLGKEVEGEVVLLKKYGAFVDFDNMRGLVHKTEISWGVCPEVRDCLYIGQKVRAKVISVDVAGKAIGLSVKALMKNPWENFLPEKCVGETMDVIVLRRRGGGLVVRTAEGFIGYISGEDCAWVGSATLIKEICPGGILSAKVISVDNQSFVFSIRALCDPPWLDLTKACSRKTALPTRIISINQEHLLLEVLPGVFASLEVRNLPPPASRYMAGGVLNVFIRRISWEKPVTITVGIS